LDSPARSEILARFAALVEVQRSWADSGGNFGVGRVCVQWGGIKALADGWWRRAEISAHGLDKLKGLPDPGLIPSPSGVVGVLSSGQSLEAEIEAWKLRLTGFHGEVWLLDPCHGEVALLCPEMVGLVWVGMFWPGVARNFP
jgi:hypothetical protein